MRFHYELENKTRPLSTPQVHVTGKLRVGPPLQMLRVIPRAENDREGEFTVNAASGAAGLILRGAAPPDSCTGVRRTDANWSSSPQALVRKVPKFIRDIRARQKINHGAKNLRESS